MVIEIRENFSFSVGKGNGKNILGNFLKDEYVLYILFGVMVTYKQQYQDSNWTLEAYNTLCRDLAQ